MSQGNFDKGNYGLGEFYLEGNFSTRGILTSNPCMSPHIFYGVVIVIDECVEWYLIIHTLSIQNPPLLYVMHINYVLNIMKV